MKAETLFVYCTKTAQRVKSEMTDRLLFIRITFIFTAQGEGDKMVIRYFIHSVYTKSHLGKLKNSNNLRLCGLIKNTFKY